MADFVVRVFRAVFMLALGALVMALVVCLLLATLAWVLGRVVWRRYRQTAAGPGRAAERADTVEVEDVVFRDVSAPPPGQDRLRR